MDLNSVERYSICFMSSLYCLGETRAWKSQHLPVSGGQQLQRDDVLQWLPSSSGAPQQHAPLWSHALPPPLRSGISAAAEYSIPGGWAEEILKPMKLEYWNSHVDHLLSILSIPSGLSLVIVSSFFLNQNLRNLSRTKFLQSGCSNRKFASNSAPFLLLQNRGLVGCRICFLN